MAGLQVKSLQKRYGTAVILHGIDLNVSAAALRRALAAAEAA